MIYSRYTIACLAALAFLVVAGCTTPVKKQRTDWSMDLKQTAKKPYSLYLAYQSLPLLFPGAETEKLDASYKMTNLGYKLRRQEGKALIWMIGQRLAFGTGEIDSLFSFINYGHDVLLVANRFDDELLTRLGIGKAYDALSAGNSIQKLYLKDRNEVLQPYPFRYKGHAIHSYFETGDTASGMHYTLGTNEHKRPDCLLFSIGEGRLILHAAPVAFTNYFLLQGSNKDYLANLFSHIPGQISKVYFCSFNYHEPGSSRWSVIWSHPATRLAFLLTLLALAVYVAFEMKRKQRIIPVIPPVENTSAAFVETIGRLYYNKKNHTNLAEKMVQHFLDYVRSHYYLNTSVLDEEFVRNLAARSGKEISRTGALIYHIRQVQSGFEADEAFLYALYTQIQEFYNGK